MRGVLTGKKKGGWLAGIISRGQGGMLLGSFQSYVRWIIHTTNETRGVDGQKRILWLSCWHYFLHGCWERSLSHGLMEYDSFNCNWMVD